VLTRSLRPLPNFLIILVAIASIHVYPTASETANHTAIPLVPLEEGETRMKNTYYIDSTNGKDSSDGLWPGSPVLNTPGIGAVLP
jgi:hypothetical protein